MQDYAKLYRREHRKRAVLEEKIRLIRRVLRAGLPKALAMIAIGIIARK